MRINVIDILSQDLGYAREFAIQNETPELHSVTLTGPINGRVTISRSKDGLIVGGRISAEIELECHRCLRVFTQKIEAAVSQSFREQPEGDDMPIENGFIDLAPLLEQEIIVNIPIKILCRTDCGGVEGASKEYS
jgi:uncharacterized protein